jgi:hypothetical protein
MTGGLSGPLVAAQRWSERLLVPCCSWRSTGRLGNAYAAELYKCEATAAQAGEERRCIFGVQPPPRRVNGQLVGP